MRALEGKEYSVIKRVQHIETFTSPSKHLRLLFERARRRRWRRENQYPLIKTNLVVQAYALEFALRDRWNGKLEEKTR